MKTFAAANLCMALFIAGPAQAASLIGDTVICSGNFDCYNQSATVGGHIEFALPTLSFDFTTDSLIVSNPNAYATMISNVVYTFNDMTKPFSQAVIIANSGVAGVTAEQVTLSSTGVLTLELGRLLNFVSFDRGSSLTISLLPSSAAAVPESSTWMMMIAGFGLVGGAIRRLNRRIAIAYA